MITPNFMLISPRGSPLSSVACEIDKTPVTTGATPLSTNRSGGAIACSIQSFSMEVRSHIQLTGRALKRWFIAQCIDSFFVGLMWLAGLLILEVPWAPFWALLGACLHFIPHVGGLFALIGPLCATLLSGNGWQGALYLLLLYVVIMVVDGLALQPALMRKASKVPLWASIVVPLVMGYFFQFWGILLSAPLLAVAFALRARHREKRELPPPVQIIPPKIAPERRTREAPPTIIEG